MSFASLAAQRRLAGLVGCGVMILIVAALVDGMIAGGLKDPFHLDLLPGQSVMLSERMPVGAERLEDISLRASAPGISLRLQETFSGFWLGGTLWRAEATLSASLPVGDYSVATFHHNGSAASPPQVFTLRVHKDVHAIQAASGSLSTRSLGLSPYQLALYLLGLALLPMAASFVLSRKISRALRQERMAEIFRARAAQPGETEGQRISFCPGPGHGLTPGSLVEVLDERAKGLLGMAEVIEVTGENIEASMHGGVQVRPGSLVRLPRPR